MGTGRLGRPGGAVGCREGEGIVEKWMACWSGEEESGVVDDGRSVRGGAWSLGTKESRSTGGLADASAQAPGTGVDGGNPTSLSDVR